MSRIQDSYLSGSNIEFIEALYARYLDDPQSVDASWRAIFDDVGREGFPIFHDKQINGAALKKEPAAPVPAAMGLQARVDQTIYAFRLRGHLMAQLDPLQRPRPPLEHVADLGMASDTHFSEEELSQLVDASGVFEGTAPVRDILARLRRTYCHHVGVEFTQISDSARRRWLQPRMELTENRLQQNPEQKKHILSKLTYAEVFENFLHTKYVGAKRFSLEGAESLIPMLDIFLERAGELGAKEVVIGMAHRGRLNVLTNLLGKSPSQIFSEFEGPADARAFMDRGDVKYHLGFSSDHVTQKGVKIHLSLAFNPSHLEAVNPVVEGRVRAKQDRALDHERVQGIPLLIHGDASFAGQGVVAETLNLSRLPYYTSGGTVHIVINNQLGFTTDPEQAQSSMYCTAVALMLDIPIFHVNADDPEACIHVMKLATDYRQTFGTDVVIDLIGYRRHGHNEGDEPSFTQPKMYELIRQHPSVRQLYSEHLLNQKIISAADAESLRQRAYQQFQAAQTQARAQKEIAEPSFLQGLWKNYRGGPENGAPDPQTGVELERIRNVVRKCSEVPPGFAPHPKIQRLLDTRKAIAEGKQPVDWSVAEMAAYGTLLIDGFPVRLTGQDTERGTFSHRHAVLHDFKTGSTYLPLGHLAEDQAACTILNSPLSEMGCLGFEFGYSLDYPDALVVWEAQFGDFANNAQVIIDQFIAASEDKWRRLSGLTLLLPHGYEGQGPEHSSARLERFLQLSAEDNIQVCYPTTPAQFFHLLRRQVIRNWRKPLIIMSPKSMLRRPEVVSPLDALSKDRFQRVIRDGSISDARAVQRLLLCSGKLYYDLAAARASSNYPNGLRREQVAIVRIEQLYPFPTEQVNEVLTSFPKLSQIYWVQEEPRSMGAWSFVFPRLSEMIASHRKAATFGYIGRVQSASPATGFHEAHVLEQQQIVEQALTRGV